MRTRHWSLLFLITSVLHFLSQIALGYDDPLTLARRNMTRAAQNEAKINLMGLRTDEMKFHAKHGFYTSDLSALGYSFPAGKESKYKVGFVAPSSPGVDTKPDIKDTDRLLNFLKESKPEKVWKYDALCKVQEIDFDKMAEKYCSDCSVQKKAFKVMAVGTSFPNTGIDVWTIDQTGKLVHVRDGAQED